MSLAFEEVCKVLGIQPGATRERKAVAVRIIELCRRGERSAAQKRRAFPMMTVAAPPNGRVCRFLGDSVVGFQPMTIWRYKRAAQLSKCSVTNRFDAGKRVPTAIVCFCLSRRRHQVLDLVSRVLKSVTNGRSQNWIETPNSVEQGRQQHLEREHVPAERFELFVSDREFSVDGGLAGYGSICISTFYFCSSWTAVYWHGCLRTHTQQNSVVSINGNSWSERNQIGDFLTVRGSYRLF